MYWYHREFYIVTTQIQNDGVINHVDAARYPIPFAESLMNDVLAGERQIEGLEFDDHTAFSVVGRIAEGLKAKTDPQLSPNRLSRWN